MVLHPAIHLEIAPQRHQDLLAEAERQRIAKAVAHAGATPAARRRRGRANASRLTSKPEIARRLDVETGLEV
jgi:hypothetical protein